jgi:adenylate cyclase
MQRITTYFAKLPHQRMLWLLVVLLALLPIAKTFQTNAHGFDERSFDQLIKHRVWGPPADPQIVIVDIDEHSLEQMRKEFGRWPWPRETLAAALDWLNQKGAHAIVFDILFADADTLNPASDMAFADSVKQSNNSYFPILRLNPVNDGISEVKAHELRGFTQPLSESSSKASPTLAVVAPTFEAIIQSGRMGYHNIYADEDGVNRFYRLWEIKDDWKLWSLPARIALDLGWPLPAEPKQLIHYTQDKNAYTRVSFSEVWNLSQSSKGLAADTRFQNAIVVIGSTATSLFDVKVTPIDTTHPGVMILANVIDNLKDQRFLKLAPTWMQLLVAWASLGLVVWVSTRIREDQMKWAAPIAPALFMALGFISLHTGSNFYLDLAQPASSALLFFTVWALYLNWRNQFFGRIAQPKAKSDTHWQSSAVLQIDFASTSMQTVLDALVCEAENTSIIRIGALHQPPQESIGLVHVLSDLSANELNHKLNAITTPPIQTWTGSAQVQTLNSDQFWNKVWADIHQAQQHWSNP